MSAKNFNFAPTKFPNVATFRQLLPDPLSRSHCVSEFARPCVTKSLRQNLVANAVEAKREPMKVSWVVR